MIHYFNSADYSLFKGPMLLLLWSSSSNDRPECLRDVDNLTSTYSIAVRCVGLNNGGFPACSEKVLMPWMTSNIPLPIIVLKIP